MHGMHITLRGAGHTRAACISVQYVRRNMQASGSAAQQGHARVPDVEHAVALDVVILARRVVRHGHGEVRQAGVDQRALDAGALCAVEAQRAACVSPGRRAVAGTACVLAAARATRLAPYVLRRVLLLRHAAVRARRTPQRLAAYTAATVAIPSVPTDEHSRGGLAHNTRRLGSLRRRIAAHIAARRRPRRPRRGGRLPAARASVGQTAQGHSQRLRPSGSAVMSRRPVFQARLGSWCFSAMALGLLQRWRRWVLAQRRGR
jgi:hypothetical protein